MALNVHGYLQWTPADVGVKATARIPSNAFGDIIQYEHEPFVPVAMPEGAVSRGLALSRLPARLPEPQAAVAAEISKLGALTGLAISCAGFTVRTGSPVLPVRIDWRLFTGLDCSLDRQAIASGSTFLNSFADNRQGLLFQVSNCLITQFLLQAQVVDAQGANFEIVGSFSLRITEGTMGGTAYQVKTGPVIG